MNKVDILGEAVHFIKTINQSQYSLQDLYDKQKLLDIVNKEMAIKMAV